MRGQVRMSRFFVMIGVLARNIVCRERGQIGVRRLGRKDFLVWL